MKKVLCALMVLAFLAMLVVAGLILERKQLIRFVVTVGATNILGAPVHIDSVSLGESGESLHMKGFRVYNPEGFKKGVLAEIPVIDAEYDAADVLMGNVLHLKTLTIEIKTLLVLRNEKGALNVDELRIVKDVMNIKMNIDTLVLTADEVIYEYYEKDGTPAVEGFNVNIRNKTYENITTAEQLGRKVLSEVLTKTTIKDAAVLGAAALAGLALAPPIGLPIAAAILISGNDSVKADFDKSYDEVYAAGVTTMKRMGKLAYENRSKGILSGSVKGGSVKIKIKEVGKRVHVTVSGRKIVRPKPQIANGVLFEMSRRLGE